MDSLRNVHAVPVAPFEVIDGRANQPAGVLIAVPRVEGDLVGFRAVRDLRGAHQFGVEAFDHLSERWHHALHIHDHHLDRPGEDREFLLQEVARDRQPMTHQDFVRSAADAGNIDAVGALGRERTPAVLRRERPPPASRKASARARER